MNSLSALACGAMASEALSAACQARLVGVTSRGLFLLLDSDRVVFLSGEAYRGPLTINLGRDMARLAELEAGAPLRLEAHRLVFPAVDLALAWADAPGWMPPAVDAPALPPGERLKRGQALARQARRYGRHSPVIQLLPVAWGLEAAGGVAAPPGHLHAGYLRAQAAWQAGDPAGMAAALGEFVGLGGGLTPSGDDLILGFLLALSRWGALCPHWPGASRQALCAGLVERVQGGSSALCAGLAGCAACGQADERLILALDGLVTGQARLEVCAAALAGWGNTSGFDALVGMGLALTGPPPPFHGRFSHAMPSPSSSN